MEAEAQGSVQCLPSALQPVPGQPGLCRKLELLAELLYNSLASAFRVPAS